MNTNDVLTYLRRHGSSTVIEQMKRFGITDPKAFGTGTPVLRRLQKTIGTDHALALSLWKKGYYEARIVAAFIADPNLMTEATMESWTSEFDSWAVCDACCAEVFCDTPFAVRKAKEWTRRKEEYVKRAGFVLMATLAVHRKEIDDDIFRTFFPLIVRHATDERNFVRKGVNWALRQIGKKNPALNNAALTVANALSRHTDPTARWIGTDALKDLQSESTHRKFARMKEKQR
jgi:3-methyladenine DNA glycosylase AlkD